MKQTNSLVSTTSTLLSQSFKLRRYSTLFYFCGVQITFQLKECFWEYKITKAAIKTSRQLTRVAMNEKIKGDKEHHRLLFSREGVRESHSRREQKGLRVRSHPSSQYNRN